MGKPRLQTKKEHKDQQSKAGNKASNGNNINKQKKKSMTIAQHVVATSRTSSILWFRLKAVGFSADLSEALLEVIRQKAVEQRVCTGVGVGQDDGEEVDPGSDTGLGDDDHQVDHVDDVERQPAEHEHHHDDHHHARHLSL